MPDPVFHQRQQLGIVARFGIEHAVGIEPRLVKSRREQVAPAHDPQHRPLGAGDDGGDEQGRGRIVPPAGALAPHFVQRAQPEARIRQLPVDVLHAEGQHRASAVVGVIHDANASEQLGKYDIIGEHNDSGKGVFCFCSHRICESMNQAAPTHGTERA